jgi:CHASE2 domain-containing sensor protein
VRLPFIQTLALSRWLGTWTRRVDGRFYVLLALVVAAVIVVDFTFTQLIGALDGTKYDKLIQYRLSSPAASPDIVIVDVDERSLAIVGVEHGRWPWPRDVLAEAIATIAEARPKALFVNVIFSEPDHVHPDADRVLQEVSAAYPGIVYPFVRLPAANDRHSQLDAIRLPGARPLDGADGAPDPVAVVLPAFADLQRRVGAANLYQDSDGIVRSYEYWLRTSAHALPSAAAAMLLAAGIEPPPPGDGLPPRLNWRNKRGDYPRVSFADLYDGMRGQGAFDARRFAGKLVVLGVSAPGIAVTKATSASIATDDNEIIATALDDAISGTALRQISPAVNVTVAVVLIALLAWAFVAQVDQAKVDSAFAAAQTGLIAITFLSVSYLTVVLDMTLPFKAAMAYYVVARSFYSARHASQRGVAEFWDTAEALRADRAVLVASAGGAVGRRVTARVRKALERALGYERVLHLSGFIDRGTFLGQSIGDTELVIGFLHGDDRSVVDTLPVEVRTADFKVIEVDLGGKGVEESREALWHAVVSSVFR